MEKGIDISSYNHVTNWTSLKKSGIKFIILRCVIKSLTADTKFEEYWKKAKENNIPVIGVYHYSYMTTNKRAVDEANAMVKVLGNRKTTVWLDIEDIKLTGMGEKLITNIFTYKSIIEKAGHKFGIYTGYLFYNGNLKKYSEKLKNIPLWVARYPYKKNMKLSDKVPSRNWDIKNTVGWQYTQAGIVPGIKGNVDLDVMY